MNHHNMNNKSSGLRSFSTKSCNQLGKINVISSTKLTAMQEESQNHRKNRTQHCPEFPAPQVRETKNLHMIFEGTYNLFLNNAF